MQAEFSKAQVSRAIGVGQPARPASYDARSRCWSEYIVVVGASSMPIRRVEAPVAWRHGVVNALHSPDIETMLA